MKTSQFPKRLLEDIQSSQGFRSALQRLRNGKSATPRSWVWEQKDPEWIKSQWTNRLTRVCEEKDLEEILTWDMSKWDKFAPQGEVAPFDERQESLVEYWAHLSPVTLFDSPGWRQAEEAAAKTFGFNGTGKPWTAKAIVEEGLYEDRYNTSSGDPLFLRRSNPLAITQALEAVSDGTWRNYYPVLGSRASMGKVGKDARWIFMFPMSVNIQESRFVRPLMDYIRTRSRRRTEISPYNQFFAPWEGFSAVQNILFRMGQSFPGSLKFGCDYTKMDQHFNWSHAESCFRVISRYFVPEVREELYETLHFVFHCPVVAPDFLIDGPHAMPSGSGWTNFLETIFNHTLLHYLRIQYHLPIITAMGIGDDQLWFLNASSKHQEDYAKFITSQFNKAGLAANVEKQEVSDTVASFLQRRAYNNWTRAQAYQGVYPTVRALTSEVYPEFYHNSELWDSKTFALRCLAILENCNRHPAYQEFVLFVAEGNSNIIQFAMSSEAEQMRVRNQAKKIANFLPTYNSEVASLDPRAFQSIKIIRDAMRQGRLTVS